MFGSKNLTKIINNKVILENVSIFVDVGEIKTVIGPSGGGKSTLLSCLSNIENPTSGEVFMDDTTLIFAHNKKLGKKSFQYPKVSLLSQGLFLWPHLSIEENISLPLKEQGIFNQEKFKSIIQRLHIDRLLDRYPLDCSGGERQRVALARNFLLESKYLLLDEITSALDIEHVQIVIDLLREIKKKSGVILITHMIQFAKKISDYVYFIDGGKIVEEGNTNTLTHPKTERLKMFLQIQYSALTINGEGFLREFIASCTV